MHEVCKYFSLVFVSEKSQNNKSILLFFKITRYNADVPIEHTFTYINTYELYPYYERADIPLRLRKYLAIDDNIDFHQ